MYSSRSAYRSDTLAVVHHLCVVLGVVVNLFADGLVLVQQTFSISQAAGDVLRRHVCLRLRQPRLEVVQVSQESMQISCFFQLRVAFLQLSKTNISYIGEVTEKL